VSLATMPKVKRRFNTIYWTDLRSCWKRDTHPLAIPIAGARVALTIPSPQLASYASFKPVVAGDATRCAAMLRLIIEGIAYADEIRDLALPQDSIEPVRRTCTP